MISFIHYISASRRHQQFQDTIVQLGGENDAPLQMRAQRDIIAMERDYYRDKMVDFFFVLAFMSVFTALGIISYFILF
jgi:hypothetical protein